MKSILASLLLAIVSGMLTFSAYAEAETATSAPAQEIVVLLDNSQSMKANDANQIGKRLVQELLNQSSQQLRVEAVLFDKDVKVLRPLSDSPPADAAAELAPINYKGALTNIPAALERAVYDLKTNAREGTLKSVLLVTDGVIDTGNKVRDADAARWMRQELAADAAKNGIALFSIALSDRTDFQLLQSLAVNTGGEYFRSYSADEVAGVLNRLSQVSLRRQAPKPEAPNQTSTPEAPVADSAAPAPTTTPAEPVAAETIEPASAIESTPVAEPTTATAQTEPLIAEPATSATEFAEDSGESQSDWGELSTLLLGVAVLTVLIALVTFFARSLRGERKPAASAAEQPAGEPSIPEAYLRDISGVTNQDSFKLDHRLSVIGRIPPTDGRQVGFLHLERGSIGRYHAFIEYKENGFVLGDQQSMNGTYINGLRVLGEQRLKHRDRIKFHNLEFEFIVPEMDHADETVLIPAGTLSEDTTVTSRRTAAALSAIVNKPAAGVATVAAAAAAANLMADTPENDEEPGTETLSLPAVANGSFSELGEGYTLPSSRAVKTALDEYFEEHCDA